MSSRVAIQAPIATTTAWGQAIEVFTSAQWVGRAPTWWAVDISVSGRLLDTTVPPGTPPPAPRLEDFADPSGTLFGARVPLHLRISYSIIDCRHPAAAAAHTRTIDAYTGRFMVYANTMRVEVLAPNGALIYDPATPSATPMRVIGASTLAALIDVGAQPEAAPDGAARLAMFTWRQHYTEATTAPDIMVPNGAQRAQVFDPVGVNWEWRQPTIQTIGVGGGQSQIVEVPGACALGPAAVSTARDAAAVFEVRL